jgi:hypothetical protein
MKTLIPIIFVSMIAFESFSQKKDIIYLWPGKVPGEAKEKQAPVIEATGKDNVLRFSEVTNPAVEVWMADPYGNRALVMAGALRNAKLPVELHLLPAGGHGYGLRSGSLAAETWPLLAEKWLRNILKTN